MIAGGRRTRRTISRRQGDELTYELLFLRSMEKDALVWQTPALAVTAQAFLLTIGLDPDTARFARGIVSTLGVVVAYMTCQLMAKHRYLRRLDEWKLRELEGRLGLPGLATHAYGDPADEYAGPTLLTRSKSYVTWQTGLVLIGLAHLLVLTLTIVWPGGLTGS